MADHVEATNDDPTPVGGKTRKCRGCGKLIPHAADKCPHCQREQGGRRLIYWAGGITTVLGLAVAAVTFFGLFDPFWPPDVQVQLTTCEQYKVVLRTTNTGGRPATAGHPTFTIASARRPPNSPLRMLSYMDVEPDDPGEIAPDAAVLRPYDAHTRFFNSAESQGGACRIRVSVPVTEDRERLPEATGECTCAYR